MRSGQLGSRCALEMRCEVPGVASRDFDAERLLATLHDAGVEFVLIGGMAAIMHGDVGVTLDVDIVPDPSMGNLDALADALRILDARIRTEGEPGGLPFDVSAKFLSNIVPDGILHLTSSAGDLDLTFRPSGTTGYGDLKRDAIEIPIDDRESVRIWVGSLADIIRSKEAAGREKDRNALPRLRRLLEKTSR